MDLDCLHYFSTYPQLHIRAWAEVWPVHGVLLFLLLLSEVGGAQILASEAIAGIDFAIHVVKSGPLTALLSPRGYVPKASCEGLGGGFDM